jgi:hypothetical protein
MTEDEIILIAQQAHFNSKTWIDIYNDGITTGEVRGYLQAFAYLVAAKALAQPQRTWVGLTEDEIIGCTCECIDQGKFNMDCAIDFAKAIEAKLKELNT